MNDALQDSRIIINTGCFGNLIEHIDKDGEPQTRKSSPGWADIVLCITELLKSSRNLLISHVRAEHIIFAIGSALPLEQERMAQVSGRNLITGLPSKIEISSIEVRESMEPVIMRLIKILAFYIQDNALTKPTSYILIKGDLARIRKLDQRLQEATGLRVVVDES